MKILVFGRGVIGAAYGWALAKAGNTVDFYVRPGRAKQYGSGIELRLLDARRRLWGQKVDERWPVKFVEELAPDHDYDLILVSVQHYRFAEVVAFLASRVGKATVLLFNNLFTEPLEAAAALPAEQVVWGFPMAGGGFDASDVLRASLFKWVQFGTFGTEPTARDLATRELFRSAGFAVVSQRDFKGWLWVHFMTNAALQSHALKVGSLAALARSTPELKEAVLTGRELLAVLVARGVDLKAHASELGLFRAPPLVGALAFKTLAKLNGPLRIVVEAHSNHEELQVTCRDMLDEARRLGVAVPRLEALERYFPAT